MLQIMASAFRIINKVPKQLQLLRNSPAYVHSRFRLGLLLQRAVSNTNSKLRESKDGATKSDEVFPKQYKFFAVGHVLLDHTARLSASDIDFLHKFHQPANSKGELDLETLRKLKQEACKRVKCIESPGGSAPNTVRILQHLGENALFIGAVGDDEAAIKLRIFFENHNINVRLFTFKDVPTGECVSIINRDTQDEVLYANIGASIKMSVENLKQAEEDLHFLRSPECKQIIYIEGFLLPKCEQLCHYVYPEKLRGWSSLVGAKFECRVCCM